MGKVDEKLAWESVCSLCKLADRVIRSHCPQGYKVKFAKMVVGNIQKLAESVLEAKP